MRSGLGRLFMSAPLGFSQPRDLWKMRQFVRGEITDLLFDGDNPKLFMSSRAPPIVNHQREYL